MPEFRIPPIFRRIELAAAALLVATAVSSVTPTSGLAWSAPDDSAPPSAPVPTWDAAPVDEGSVTLVGNDRQPISNGGSTTPYSLELPDGAACPGDTASGNWLVQGFLIPATDDPGEIEYGVIGPEGTQFPLFAYDSRPYAHQVTRVSSSPDDPGVISPLPELSFAVFEPGYIPPGRYRIGVACTFFRQTARYWDTEIVIEADPDDVPAQLTWRLPDASAFDSSSVDDGASSRWPIVAGILGVGLLIAWLLMRSTRRDGRDAATTGRSRDETAASTDIPPDGRASLDPDRISRSRR